MEMTPSRIMGKDKAMVTDFIRVYRQHGSLGEYPEREIKKVFSHENRRKVGEILDDLKRNGFLPRDIGANGEIVFNVIKRSPLHEQLEQTLNRPIPFFEEFKPVTEFTESIASVNSVVLSMQQTGVLTEDEAGAKLRIITDCLFTGDTTALEAEKEKLRSIYRSNSKLISEAVITDVL